jgi:hypothetical protein
MCFILYEKVNQHAAMVWHSLVHVGWGGVTRGTASGVLYGACCVHFACSRIMSRQ